MNLVDKIKRNILERSQSILECNKEFFDYIDETMEKDNKEICEAIGNSLVDLFNKNITANTIEVRCYEPVYDSRYPLGKKYPEHMGILWCEILKKGDAEICGSYIFKETLELELTKRQPNVEQSSFIDNFKKKNICFDGKYLKSIDKHCYVKEQCEDLKHKYSLSPHSTGTLFKYKLFQIFNDYIIPYLENEGFIIERVYDNGIRLKYTSKQTIYIKLPK